MKDSRAIRQAFLDFFAAKGHKIVPSAPIVNKDDPTLMFTNAGMNQFKDYFLGTREPQYRRVADTQKCLRVSGKHNDLEEVGRDGYHHTMFEMLGNWSFGDYFKEEAIAWAWELLTEVYGIDEDRLYVTVFEGAPGEGLARDTQAAEIWKKYVPESRILYFGKKDNFWEMGEQGPCGPCSEIHVDLRTEQERRQQDARTLVNADDPRVIELWNLVFIQFNRKADGSLEALPARHVDTGMGFERLCMVLQGKLSSYDTDVFAPLIRAIEQACGKTYTASYAPQAHTDIAMRVVADHVRAVAFAIADGQLPGNTGAGYVIRRILRRAVRYYYSFLEIDRPFLCKLVPVLAEQFDGVFPELKAQQEQVARVVEGEEKAFLQTLENGLRRFDNLEVQDGLISGQDAFELYDTYGFPIDLTRLIAEERGWRVDEAGFEKALQAQKERSRAAAQKTVGDWTVLAEGEDVAFLGYDTLVVEDARIVRYRKVKTKKGEAFQLVLDKTPFYAESGGQRGDRGWLVLGDERIEVRDTQKENELIVHLVERLPADPTAPVRAEVDAERRQATSANHSATHLMHAALHRVLGPHALQKGQDVDDRRIRFDFSHFQKLTEEEIAAIERLVNEKIRQDIPLEEVRDIPLEEAKKAGAIMLFGEKYGERVRMITFDPEFSRELCGGTHVPSTGRIGLFKIVGETSVAAGIRRIEALTAKNAEEWLAGELDELRQVRALFKNPKRLVQQVEALLEENRKLRKTVEQLQAARAAALKGELKRQALPLDGYKLLVARVPLDDGHALKTLAHQLEKELAPAIIVLGAIVKDKPQLLVLISRSLVEQHPQLHAGQLVRRWAAFIKGGGGGQPFLATAGGKEASGLERALEAARQELTASVS